MLSSPDSVPFYIGERKIFHYLSTIFLFSVSVILATLMVLPFACGVVIFVLQELL
jgi:hypothetical protein